MSPTLQETKHYSLTPQMGRSYPLTKLPASKHVMTPWQQWVVHERSWPSPQQTAGIQRLGDDNDYDVYNMSASSTDDFVLVSLRRANTHNSQGRQDIFPERGAQQMQRSSSGSLPYRSFSILWCVRCVVQNGDLDACARFLQLASTSPASLP